MLAALPMPEDIVGSIQTIVVMAVPFLLAITCHEVAHGYVAYLLGDPTAKSQGRLTLNPLKHLDPLGVVAFVIARIGWAKPVPVDARYFKNPRRDMMYVAVAGPAVNFALAVVFAFLYRWMVAYAMQDVEGSNASMIIPPVISMLEAGVVVNLILGVFNLLPIPPLDGSNILAGLLPPKTANSYMRFSKYGFVLIILLAVTGILGYVLWPPVMALYHILL